MGTEKAWGWYGVSAEAWVPNMIANKYRPGMQDDSTGKRIKW